MATINNPYYIFQTYGTNYTQIPLNFILNNHKQFKKIYRKKITDDVVVRKITKQNKNVYPENDVDENFIKLNKLIKENPKVAELIRVKLYNSFGIIPNPFYALIPFFNNGYVEIYIYLYKADEKDVTKAKKQIKGNLHAISEGNLSVKYNGVTYDPFLYDFFSSFLWK